MPTISIRSCTQTSISGFSQFTVLYIAIILYYLYRFSYSLICFFARNNLLYNLLFSLVPPLFYTYQRLFYFFTSVWRKLLFLVWRFYSIKGHLCNNKRRNVPYNHTIDSFAQKAVSFFQRFPYHGSSTLGFSFVKEVFFAQKISVASIHHLQRLLLFEQKGASFVQNRGFLFVLLCLLKHTGYTVTFYKRSFFHAKNNWNRLAFSSSFSPLLHRKRRFLRAKFPAYFASLPSSILWS